MKNARPHEVETSALDKRDSTAGILPKRINTVLAGVLAEFIEGRTVTGMSAVFGQHTTRAAAVIHYLETQYAWTIERRDIATGTTDGRIAWVKAYWLPAAAREAAFKAGARTWIDQVRAAAKKRRKGASKARKRAATLNTMRIDPRQIDLFGGLA
jgi:hypothetical protein